MLSDRCIHVCNVVFIGGGSRGTGPPLKSYTLVPPLQVAIPQHVRIPEVRFACSPVVHVNIIYSLKRQIIILFQCMDHVSENGATTLHSIMR